VISIRPAFAADVAQLIALDTIAYRSEERRQAIADWAGAGECHVALGAGRITGYAALTRSFFRSPFIEMLMVAEADRRAGIGRALIEHCIGLTPPSEKLWTSTNLSNTPMQALLPQLGFVRCGMFEHLDPGDPELIYMRWPTA
jgi:ribosomal protein S18 acetylase RimI-like enzyme